jgi:intron-binding protein aquarius
MSASHADRIQNLQRLAFKHFPELREMALANIASVDTRSSLLHHLGQLSDERLRELCVLLNLLPDSPPDGKMEPREFMMEIIIFKHERRISQLDAINEMPLYPSETLLWDQNVVPAENYTGETVLALPKLNLQFLTFHDYLLRNFNLFRLESTYEIKDDIEDAVRRVNARRDYDGGVKFTGWSRMALAIKEFRITTVSKPNIGESKPAQVVAEVTYTLAQSRGPIREEWEAIKQHDVLFLLTIRPPSNLKVDDKEKPDPNLPFPEQFGVHAVRGCEVMEVVDEENNVLKDIEVEGGKQRSGNLRIARVRLDAAQYQLDMSTSAQSSSVYDSFNLLMRRKPKENNFKAVLETIRDLMNTRCVVPDWLHDVFLGYGDPGASIATNKIPTIDFNDTFLNVDHLVASFPGHKFQFTTEDRDKLVPPFRITFPSPSDVNGENDKSQDKDQNKPLVVEPYVPPNPGPYPYNKPKQNQIPFTPIQVEAIRSGINEGLTMVVGPPGTGKTDVAVQIISCLYHNFPEQRILLVTHSNQALNQLFEKIMALNINERHLLRLGHGEKTLETEKDFSKFGRVNYMLALRLQHLAEVERLAATLNLSSDVAYTCETAAHFFRFHVLARWEEFLSNLEDTDKQPDTIANTFPFLKFFENAPQPLFKCLSFEEDMEIAEGCWRHINTIFTELEECRAFELLRSSYDRANYLLTKQAKVIAMTCTHAALKRGDLVSMGFKYDSLLMEEAAQILEIETFIPMLLQNTDEKEGPRLKRAVLIGDHHQLPPIIKNMAFQKYSHMDQSLFTRFVRLGVPTIDLDMQGRARQSLADLYNWRYKKLGNLPNVLTLPEFHTANAGFAYDYQLVDVGDYEGRGETEPNPYFYQNLGEAEYVVAVYMYMRLLGYPASKISIITTYNGQKFLLRDVLRQRCAWNPIFGMPAKVTTVDRFQGQQNDYILLSLVRTKTVGHIRDVRRLVVAMSRARLGLYVFCRKSLFENCYELTPTFSKLLQRPSKLQLVQNENWPTTRTLSDPFIPFQAEDCVHMGSLVTPITQ